MEMEDNGLDLTTKNVGICQGRSVKLYAEFMASAEWGNRLDRPMSFNQLMNMLKVTGMLGADLPPGKIKHLWHETCHVSGVQTTVQKANNGAECTRAEFVEIVIAVRRITVPAAARPGRTGGDKKPHSQQQNQDLLEQWFQEVFFPFCSQAMPMRGDALVRSTMKKDHHLSTETASLNQAKDRLAKVPIFQEIADDRFIEVVGKALQVRLYFTVLRVHTVCLPTHTSVCAMRA